MKKEIIKQPKSLEGKIDDLALVVDNLAIAMANGFSSLKTSFESSLRQEIDSVKTILATKADRSDILAFHDKFPSNEKFDKLSVRVSALEVKKNR